MASSRSHRVQRLLTPSVRAFASVLQTCRSTLLGGVGRPSFWRGILAARPGRPFPAWPKAAEFRTVDLALITCIGRWCGTDPRTIVLCRPEARCQPAPSVA